MENQIKKYTANDRTRRLRFIWALVFVLFFLSVAVVLGVQIKSKNETLKTEKGKALRKDQIITNVVALDLIPGLVRDRINLPGIVHPWVNLTVVAEVRGKIIAKQVVEGSSVRKGDILAKIDVRDYQNTYDAARASYAAAKATRERLEALHQDQLSTRTQLDDAKARMETAKATMDNAALNLERCIIRAPMDGVVDRLFIEKGQFLNPADPIAQILQINRVKVEVGIPESDVDAVRQVKHFKVTIDALAGKIFDGTQHYLAKSADSMARLYRLQIAVDNPNGEILPDMFTRVEIIKHQVTDGLTVPRFALVNQKEGNGVYLAEDGKARWQSVQIGIQEGWQVQIAEGLFPGAQVIVVGQRGLNHGDPVKVVRIVQDVGELNL